MVETRETFQGEGGNFLVLLTSATRRVAKKVAGGRSLRRPPGMRN